MNTVRTVAYSALLTTVSLLLLVGCGDQNKTQTATSKVSSEPFSSPADDPALSESPATTDGSDGALASVDGVNITEDDLAILLNRIGGRSTQVFAEQLADNEDYRKNMLEGLVNSRAMAILSERQLSAEEKETLDRQVHFYREELLVKRYLDANMTPEPVTTQMVKEYYESNLQSFREDSQITFDVMTSYGELSEKQRKQLLPELEKAKQSDDWKKVEQRLKKANLPVRYQQAEARPKLLTPSLQTVLQETPVGQVSDIEVGDTIRIVRVVKEKQGQVKPLAEVSGEIRKRLAPVMMKKAISQAAEQARQQVTVEWK